MAIMLSDDLKTVMSVQRLHFVIFKVLTNTVGKKTLWMFPCINVLLIYLITCPVNCYTYSRCDGILHTEPALENDLFLGSEWYQIRLNVWLYNLVIFLF
jgi:hypothetical protein